MQIAHSPGLFPDRPCHDRLNASLAEGHRIRGFGLLPRALSAHDEEMTPALRIQRRMAERSFSEQIEALYSA